MFGKQSIDSDTGQVGPITAEFLNLPQITNAIDISADEQSIIVNQVSNGYIIKFEVTAPTVISVTEKVNSPRLPTIYSINKSSKAKILVWNEEDILADPNRIGIKGSPTIVRKIIEPKKMAKKTVFLEGSPKEAVTQLIGLITE